MAVHGGIVQKGNRDVRLFSAHPLYMCMYWGWRMNNKLYVFNVYDNLKYLYMHDVGHILMTWKRYIDLVSSMTLDVMHRWITCPRFAMHTFPEPMKVFDFGGVWSHVIISCVLDKLRNLRAWNKEYVCCLNEVNYMWINILITYLKMEISISDLVWIITMSDLILNVNE